MSCSFFLAPEFYLSSQSKLLFVKRLHQSLQDVSKMFTADFLLEKSVIKFTRNTSTKLDMKNYEKKVNFKITYGIYLIYALPSQPLVNYENLFKVASFRVSQFLSLVYYL